MSLNILSLTEVCSHRGFLTVTLGMSLKWRNHFLSDKVSSLIYDSNLWVMEKKH